MNSSKSEENQRSNNGGEFFGAVSKNCRTVVVEKTKNGVRKKINRLKIAKNNIAIFSCSLAEGNTIAKKPIHNLRFKLTNLHHTALTDACLNFLAQSKTV